MACLLLAMPTTFSFSPFCCISFGCWMRICSNRLPPTVPTPAMKRFNTLYWERKKESWIEFNALRRYFSLMTKEMFVSEAPCAQAITLIPALPSVPNNLPAIPGVRFMFSPTIATVARSFSATVSLISPWARSSANSSSNTLTARSASAFRTANVVLFSELACDTINTLMPFFANVLKIR